MIVGIVGGGQLGRMLAHATIPLGLTCRVIDPSPTCPARVVAEQIVGEYDDYAALAEFVRGLDVVTYEFENVPVETAEWLNDRIPVFPPPRALAVAQDRLTEKQFLQGLGAKFPRFAAIETRDDLDRAVATVKLPAVLKTRRFGYDGKGQVVLRNPADVEPAWLRLGGRPLILEELVGFDREVSLLAVRDRGGATGFYPLIENVHREGILRTSRVLLSDDPAIGQAVAVATHALHALNYVGVLAIEYFQRGTELLVNEMAPRVHNSGHWTIEGASPSQFSNHMRAVAGLALGPPEVYSSAGMVNCIGAMPNPELISGVAGAAIHDYGKSPRANRKVGHITVTAPSREMREERMRAVEKLVVS
ncbi:MAG: 5-(carboxyamino)imidazole ribonucleotide synthase [Gemmataceae bacterium]|nr:5-(carboxyamino)imidazole ribonucleotide synthase [Gemmataceae bacterium]